MGNTIFRGLTAPKPFDGFSKKNCTVDYVGDPTPHANVEVSRIKGGVCAHAWICRRRLFFLLFTVRRYALQGICYRNSVCLPVCPSVRLSVTLVDCVHMVRPTIMISSPYGSSIDERWISRSSQNSKGSPRARALNEGGVGTNWRFSTNKSPYFLNGARYDKGYY